jgi:hypothetical protein
MLRQKADYWRTHSQEENSTTYIDLCPKAEESLAFGHNFFADIERLLCTPQVRAKKASHTSSENIYWQVGQTGVPFRSERCGLLGN